MASWPRWANGNNSSVDRGPTSDLRLVVNDRRVLAHPRFQLRLRFIQLPRPHLRVCCETGCHRRKRQGYSHNCNSSFHMRGIPAETRLDVKSIPDYSQDRVEDRLQHAVGI